MITCTSRYFRKNQPNDLNLNMPLLVKISGTLRDKIQISVAKLGHQPMDPQI